MHDNVTLNTVNILDKKLIHLITIPLYISGICLSKEYFKAIITFKTEISCLKLFNSVGCQFPKKNS